MFLSHLELVRWSMFSSNCCFLTCIQSTQEADKLVRYSHLLKNFPQLLGRATQDGCGMLESSDRTWSAAEGSVKPPQYFSLENLMSSVNISIPCFKLFRDQCPQSCVPGYFCHSPILSFCTFWSQLKNRSISRQKKKQEWEKEEKLNKLSMMWTAEVMP